MDWLACHQLTPELAERIAGIDAVVFVDAAAGQTPGSVAVTELRSSGQPTALAHTADPPALLGLARALYGHAPHAWLVAIGAGSFELGEGLSEPVAAAVPHAVAVVRGLFRHGRARPGHPRRDC